MKNPKNKMRLALLTLVLLCVNLLTSPNFVLAQEFQSFTLSTTAHVLIGDPPTINCPRGWTVTGHVSQGPDVGSHADGNEAIDIGAPLDSPVYATLSGQVIYAPDFENSPNLSIGIRPVGECRHQNTNGLLQVVYYFHLKSRLVGVGDLVNFGDQIGTSGMAGTGPHVHYQFNETGNRSFPVNEPPYIPTFVERDCADHSPNPCEVETTAPPVNEFD